MTESADSIHSDGALSLHAIPADVSALIEPHMHPRTFAAGEFLIRQGDRADSILVIREGVVEVFTSDESEGGGRQHINKASRGDVLGEMALLSGEPRSASVIALTPVSALILPAERFHELARQYPALSAVLTKLVAARLAGVGPDVLHGKTFHDHRIVRRLGRGGMSIVYEALTPDSRRVALKMMSHSLVYDDFAREQFEREARTIENLAHDNIVRVFGRFAAFHSFFIVMEHVDGATLSDVIQLRGALPADEAKKIVGQLAQAVIAAHQADLVHRDIKPANVMVTRDGTVKLMDFGLATPVIDEAIANTRKHIVGTPRYMAPEQLAGEPADFAADYFAFGVTACELLTGRPLFEEKTLPQLLLRHQRWNLLDELFLPPAAAEWCRPLLEDCFVRAPHQRRPDLHRVAAWAGPVDWQLLPGGEDATDRAAWEDDTILE